jgi:hypothetical protein
MNFPRHRVSKNIQVKMTPQVGVMECEYRHLVRAFGNPSFSINYGDDFDGIEKCAWHIEFEGGEVVKISDVRPFGTVDIDYKTIKKWKVNTLSSDAYQWVMTKIRESNPGG